MCKVHHNHQEPFFFFQKKKFIWNPDKKHFEKLRYIQNKDMHTYQATVGLTTRSIINSAMETYGPNNFDIPVPTFQELFKEHMIAPFFVFQLFCVALWFLDDMWYYSLFTLAMLFVFESTVVMQRLQSMKEMRSMSMKPYNIMVHRLGKWITVTTEDLLPGDLVSITRQKDEGNAIPCDLVLVDGTAIVNEAMLSGESTPLLKESIALRDANDELDEKGEDKLHILFGGTKVLQITPPTQRPHLAPPDGGCLAHVLRTGFGTSQGSLVRTIIYSTERVTANNKEAFVFILFLLVFAVMAAGYVWIEGTKNEIRKKSKILLDCVLIVTSVVPPELPMELSLAVNNSLIALAKLYVFCTEPFRIPFAGKLDVLAFDKTGTLTDTNLVVEGIGGLTDSEKLSEPREAPKETILTLAAAHALVHVEDGVVGDPMEKRTVDCIDWSVGKNDWITSGTKFRPQVSGKIRILRRFQFSSALKRMSTVCEYHDASGKRHQFVAVKGAPETLASMYTSVPAHYQKLYKTWAKQGSRVLALGYAKLDKDYSSSEIKDISRDKVERNLTFVGFLVFHCPLKNDSVAAINMLSKSSHRVIMITGDNPLTACHVAKEVGIVSKQALILDLTEDGHLVWQDLDGTIEITQAKESDVIDPRIYEHHLCVTGRALSELEMSPVFEELLPRLWVYARVSPSQKELIITSLNELGYNTLMCGDGTNDVGALKQAHVGVALLDATPEDLHKLAERLRQRRMEDVQKKQKELVEKWGLKLPDNHPLAQGQNATPDNPMAKMMSEMASEADQEVPTLKFGDASIAAPFTSKISSIMSVVNIVRQGRATLVAMLQMYKILALNCIISAYSMSVLYLAGIKQGDWQATIAGLLLTVCFFSIAKSTVRLQIE
jgi:cation-transporting ATPase 13A1